MFLQLNTLWDGPIKQLLADADAWLCKRRTGTAGRHLVPPMAFVLVLLKRLCPTDLCEKEPFLDTEDGLPFRSVFKHVRLQYIINDLASARILERDNILPPGENENEKTSFFFFAAVSGRSGSYATSACVCLHFHIYYSIPDWLTSVYKSQWFAMLRTEFDNDNG